MAMAEPTFHSNSSAAYILHNDAVEQDRLELQSKAMVALMNGLQQIDFREGKVRAESSRQSAKVCGNTQSCFRRSRVLHTLSWPILPRQVSSERAKAG